MGVIHFFIFWGFIVIAFGTLQIIAEGIHPGFTFPWAESYAFLFIKDLLSLIVLAGLLVIAYIRYVVRKTRLEPSAEAGIILGLIFFLILSEFFYSGFTYALDPTPASEGAFVATAIAGWVGGLSDSALELGRTILWWIHVVLLLAFLVYIPISKHMHLIMCPVNEWLRNLKPRGAQIVALDLENEDIEEFGVSKVQGFTQKQLLDVYACAECGRCQEHCPATQSGKALNPKLLMTKLKEHLDETGAAMRKAEAAKAAAEGRRGRRRGQSLRQDRPPPKSPRRRSSATCSPRTRSGPAPPATPARSSAPSRTSTSTRSSTCAATWCSTWASSRAEAQLACRNIEKNSNPWGVGNQNRANWAKDLDIPVAGTGELGEYLYWVGCAGSFDDRNQKVSKAIVALLREAGVTFSILGSKEKCCGDPARRIGNEYLFQSLAQENIDTMNGLGVKKIIAQCPHCLNTIKNEYPAFGGDYEVIHHTQLLADLLKQGRLKLGTARRARSAAQLAAPASPTTTPAIWAAISRNTRRRARSSRPSRA